MTDYFRPLVQSGPSRPETALPLAGGALWFSHAECLSREAPPAVVPASEMPVAWRDALTAPRAPVAGLSMDVVRLMGILNVTPDSFSDGGRHDGREAAVAHAADMTAAGADMIDVGGESTRPGAAAVPEGEELARVEPVIAAISGEHRPPVSIDTRKRKVAEGAVAAGAALVNDVSGLTFDEGLAPFCAEHALPVCVMHAQGDPETMQHAPRYDNVLLDVYDWLAQRVAELEAKGIPRGRIVIDPGIGFGKSIDHNLALLNGISLFHGIGCSILLGASRKGFIGKISGTEDPAARMPGSVAVALAAAAQGVQILRIHDVAETRAALALWQAVNRGRYDGT